MPAIVRICFSFAAMATLSFTLPLQAAVQLHNPNDAAIYGDGMPGEGFGTNVVVDGTTAVVSSMSTGTVRVYEKQNGTWQLQTKLETLGSALALEGDRLIVGAPDSSGDGEHGRGAAYVFERANGQWQQVQTLRQPVACAQAHFGSAVALVGDMIAVGAPQTQVEVAEEAGRVTLFERDAQGWHARQEIVSPQPRARGMFGASLTFANGELLVGGHDAVVETFALTGDQWRARQRLHSAGVVSGGFVHSFAASADRLLVGAFEYGQDSSGAVVEWRREQGRWVESRILRPTNEPDLHHFGIQVVHHGNDVWSIAAERRTGANRVEGAYVYTYAAVDGALGEVRHFDVPHSGLAGWAVDALAVDGEALLVGLPFAAGAPWSYTGEVRIIDPDGTQSLLSPGGTADMEKFGNAVVAGPRWLLVGAPEERRRSAHSGAVYAYDLQHFDPAPSHVLFDPEAESRSKFGFTLALSGETLLVGVPGNGSSQSVQAYDYDGVAWQRTERWTSPQPDSGFGRVLAADADAVVVGAPWETGASRGAAYVYERAGSAWQAPIRLQPNHAQAADTFGESVAIDGRVIAVGSVTYGPDVWELPTIEDTHVRVFEKSAGQWSDVAKLVYPDASQPGDDDVQPYFGKALAVLGDFVFASAPQRREVHVFHRQGGQWVWLQRIAAPASASARFGDRLQVFAGDLWIAAPGLNDETPGTLHRYAFSRERWRLAQTLRNAEPGLYQGYGVDFAVEGGLIFAGVPYASGHTPAVRAAGRVDIDVVNLFASGFDD